MINSSYSDFSDYEDFESFSDFESDIEDTLVSACENKNSELAKELLENGANISEMDEFGYTALHYASQNGMDEVVKKIVKTSKEAINTEAGNGNEFNETPLILAVNYEHFRSAKTLIKYGADVNTFSSNKGRYPLHFAALNGNLALIKLLVENGASIYAKDSKNHDIIHYLEKNKTENIWEILDFLVEKGYEKSVLEDKFPEAYILDEINEAINKPIEEFNQSRRPNMPKVNGDLKNAIIDIATRKRPGSPIKDRIVKCMKVVHEKAKTNRIRLTLTDDQVISEIIKKAIENKDLDMIMNLYQEYPSNVEQIYNEKIDSLKEVPLQNSNDFQSWKEKVEEIISEFYSLDVTSSEKLNELMKTISDKFIEVFTAIHIKVNLKQEITDEENKMMDQLNELLVQYKTYMNQNEIFNETINEIFEKILKFSDSSLETIASSKNYDDVKKAVVFVIPMLKQVLDKGNLDLNEVVEFSDTLSVLLSEYKEKLEMENNHDIVLKAFLTVAGGLFDRIVEKLDYSYLNFAQGNIKQEFETAVEKVARLLHTKVEFKYEMQTDHDQLITLIANVLNHMDVMDIQNWINEHVHYQLDLFQDWLNQKVTLNIPFEGNTCDMLYANFISEIS